MIINPEQLTITDWCDSTAFNLSTVVSPIKLMNETEWRDWALSVIQSLNPIRASLPDPRQFEFREWADRFNQAIESLV